MKAILSTTYDDKYIYYLPIVTYCWNKLGVDVICFIPEPDSDEKNVKLNLSLESIGWANSKNEVEFFNAPEHKEATYAQCSRLYGACLDLPEDEILVSGDVDMAMFRLPEYRGGFTIFGADLVPDKQYPMCYISAQVKDWRRVFNLRDFSYQQCLDGILGDIDCDNMRGNYWAKDQNEAYLRISSASALVDVNLIPRAKEGTQFSTRRYDRDDSYILDRLSPDTIDFHMNRPGYEDKNFEIILTILKYHYPDEDFQWLIDYTNAYKQLL